MKSILLTFFIAFLGLQVTTAQDINQASTDQTPKEKSAKIAESLNLTDKKEVKVKKKLTSYARNKKELKAQVGTNGFNKADFEKRLSVLKESKMNEMRQILTQAQFAKYKKLLLKTEQK